MQPHRERYTKEVLGCILWIILFIWLFSNGTVDRVIDSVRETVETRNDA